VRSQPLGFVTRLIERTSPDLVLYAGDDVERLGPLPDCARLNIAAEAIEDAESREPEDPLFKAFGFWSGRSSLLAKPCRVKPWDAFKQDLEGSAAPGRTVRLPDGTRVLALQIGEQGRLRNTEQAQEYLAGLNPLGSRMSFRHAASRLWCMWIARRPKPPSRLHRALDAVPLGLAGVLGNDCHPIYTHILRAPGRQNLHESPMTVGDLAILGLQGSPAGGIGYILSSDEERREHLEAQLATTSDLPCLLVSHTPPEGVLDEARRFGPDHIGCRVVRDVIEHNPRLVGLVCGHVHREGGKAERLEECLVVNVASHDHEGAPLRYALLRWEDGALHLDELNLEPITTTRTSWIWNIGEVREAKLTASGIGNIGEVVQAQEGVIEAVLGGPTGRLIRHQARAQMFGHPVVFAREPFPDPLIYLDVETSDDTKDDPWLIGVLLPDEQEVRQLVELDAARHGDLFTQLGELVDEWPEAPIASWTTFDWTSIRKAHERLGLSLPPWMQKACWLDLPAAIRKRLALHSPNYRLKTVGSFLGYPWPPKEVDGAMVGWWYRRWRDEGIDFDIEVVKRYNVHDVKAMRFIVEHLTALLHDDGA